jgi:hypothetical protein
MGLKAKLFASKKPSDRHYYAYDVEIIDGDLIVQGSRDPEHALARALLARGLTGKVTIFDGVTDKPQTIVNIENAAKWCVGSNLDRYRWTSKESGNSSPPAAEGDLVLPTLPDERIAA